MKYHLFFFSILLLAFGCIGDDVIFDEVPEAVRITTPLDTIGVGDEFQLEAMYTNTIGVEEAATILWESTDPSIVSVNSTGLLTAIEKGEVEIVAKVELDQSTIEDRMTLISDEETVIIDQTKSGVINTTSSYNLKGSFTIADDNGKLIISIADDYEASTALPGLYIYFSNNPSSTSSAFEIGAVDVFDGSHTYEVEGVGINDFQYLLYWCKPFNVKVGEGVIE